MRGLAVEFLALAEKQKATVPLMTGHRLMGVSLLNTGNFAEARTHLDQRDRALRSCRASCIGDPIWPRRSRSSLILSVADPLVARLSRHCPCGCGPCGQGCARNRTSRHFVACAGPLSMTHIHCGNYAVAGAQLDEVVALADETGALLWKWVGRVDQGCVLAASGKASDAVRMITSGITAWRSTGTTVWQPVYLLYLARSYGELGQFDGASRCVGEALTAVRRSKESWYEAEIHRIGGALALIGLKPDAAKAQGKPNSMGKRGSPITAKRFLRTGYWGKRSREASGKRRRLIRNAGMPASRRRPWARYFDIGGTQHRGRLATYGRAPQAVSGRAICSTTSAITRPPPAEPAVLDDTMTARDITTF